MIKKRWQEVVVKAEQRFDTSMPAWREEGGNTALGAQTDNGVESQLKSHFRFTVKLIFKNPRTTPNQQINESMIRKSVVHNFNEEHRQNRRNKGFDRTFKRLV